MLDVQNKSAVNLRGGSVLPVFNRWIVYETLMQISMALPVVDTIRNNKYYPSPVSQSNYHFVSCVL
jgi:hypothetical protein